MQTGRADLAETFVVVDPQKRTHAVRFTPTVFDEIQRDFDGFRGCELIASFEFDTDWTSWEMHPNGDEVVILLSGQVTLVLAEADEKRSSELSRSGEYAIVPCGVWHRARTQAEAQMLFVTPGEGTRHMPA